MASSMLDAGVGSGARSSSAPPRNVSTKPSGRDSVRAEARRCGSFRRPRTRARRRARPRPFARQRRPRMHRGALGSKAARDAGIEDALERLLALRRRRHHQPLIGPQSLDELADADALVDDLGLLAFVQRRRHRRVVKRDHLPVAVEDRRSRRASLGIGRVIEVGPRVGFSRSMRSTSSLSNRQIFLSSWPGCWITIAG